MLARLYNYLFMKSTIKIALGQGNEPVIDFHVRPSDDLRDQVANQFLHGLGGDSNLCHVVIVSNRSGIDGPIEHRLEISPLPPHSVWVLHQNLTNIIRHYNKVYPDLGMFSTGDTIELCNKVDTNRSIQIPVEDLRKLSLVDLVNSVSGYILNICQAAYNIIDQYFLDTHRDVMISKGYELGKTFGFELGADSKIPGPVAGNFFSRLWYYTGKYGSSKQYAQLSTLEVNKIPDYNQSA